MVTILSVMIKSFVSKSHFLNNKIDHTNLSLMQVLDFPGIDQIPVKHIGKHWTKDTRVVLPEHLAHLQKDKISVNSITFRCSNL
uniref:Uncharacterized protein n=1 Tax=Aegilops tauschii subsp. strangulata TaxID=200361 RepID=A0A453NNR6_AEGTS